MQESPAKLGTPWVVGFCYVSSIDSPAGLLCFADAACYVCYQGVPCCLDQDADPRQHVGGLDKYIYCSNLVLSTSLRSWQAFRLIFSDPATRYLRNLPAGSGTMCVHVI